MERRLAVILAADVVGCSRLMEADEEGTLAQLRSHREELVNPTIAKHHGRVVKLVGDGVLVEFGSAAEAVRCPISLQEGMASRILRAETFSVMASTLQPRRRGNRSVRSGTPV
jgi:adenylate cyclase